MPIAPFPHRYLATLDRDTLVAEPRAPIPTGAPLEFGGTDAVWSPEQLLVGAALSCLKSTFDAYARRAKLTIHHWRGTGTGVLVKGREGPVFEVIALEVELVTEPGEEARAQEVLDSAAANCIVSRALVAPVHVTARITSSGKAEPSMWDDIRRIADQLELKIHLARMDLRDRWRALEPKLAELEKDIQASSDRATKAITREVHALQTLLHELNSEVDDDHATRTVPP
jgi:organic hydroperoxide reductase OsmC/OhrA